MSHKKAVYLLHITIPVLLAVVSVFLLANLAEGSEHLAGVAASIDESREDVMKLAASSTAVSVAITALPGDLATPVASTLADLSKGFLIVLCALYLEKLLFPILGMIVFKWLIPLACLVYIAGFLLKNAAVIRASKKLLCFALILFLLVPAEAGIAELIRENYGETMAQTVESAENSAKLIEESVEENNVDETTGNGLGLILKNLQQTGDQIARGTSQFMKYLEKLVSRFMEAAAVMLVTSCVIPVLILLGFIWVTKLLLTDGFDNHVKWSDADKFLRRLQKGERHGEDEENKASDS